MVVMAWMAGFAQTVSTRCMGGEDGTTNKNETVQPHHGEEEHLTNMMEKETHWTGDMEIM